MTKRVLIVSPHFPPVNAADHQRIRSALPYFQEFGWEVSVLCANPTSVETVKDSNLTKTVPSHIEIIQCNVISPYWSRKFGIGDLGIRSIWSFVQSTREYFKRKCFQIVYLSNTVFSTMILGRYWWDTYQIPYVIDFQDLWLSNYYGINKNVPPPGGKIRYGISRTLAKALEPYTLKKVSHVTSVSPDYSKALIDRYDWLDLNRFTLLPFGAPESDFELLPKLQIEQNIFDLCDGNMHWVYVGRVAEDMFLSLKLLFLAIQLHQNLDPCPWQKIKIHFIGTKYSIFDNTKEIEDLAKNFKLENIVFQYPQRIPYFEALQVLNEAHGIIILGSDDASYSPSKVYPCVLAKKPILAMLYQNSLVAEVLTECKAGRVVEFIDEPDIDVLVNSLINELEWLIQSSNGDGYPETDFQSFEKYTAKQMTKKLCEIFNEVTSVNR